MTQAAGKRILHNTVNQIKTKNKNTKLIFKRENRDLSAHTPPKNGGSVPAIFVWHGSLYANALWGIFVPQLECKITKVYNW